MRILQGAACILFFLAISAGSLPAIEPIPNLHIDGYAGKVSCAPGETITFHTSTTATTFDVRIERVGLNRELIWEKKKIPGSAHPVPEHASSKGCGWPASFELSVPESWKSGYYEVRFRAEDRGGKFTRRNRRTAESSCYFIVRSATPGKTSPILLQLATNTYNAYNNWGGTSLYGYHGRGGVQGHEVSFLRPPQSQFSKWELPFAVWAENNGFSLDYASNMDLQLIPDLLKNYKLVLSVGHDEYWSWEMRDAAENFIKEGGNFAFFSGNTCCWQVRWQEKSRSLLCWKQWYNQDPFYKTENQNQLSTLWSHRLINRPENHLTGVGFLHGGYHRSHGQFMDGTGAFTVHRSNHWALQGTGLKEGDEFGGKDTIVGYECDGCQLVCKDGKPAPSHQDGTPANFEVIATCPAKWAPGDAFWYEHWPGKDHKGHAVAGTWTSKGGGVVFTSGTTDWAHGLKGKDPHVETITKNVLERLGN